MASAKRKGASKRVKDTLGLSAQREKFCQQYALSKNGAKAYAEAYPASKKQSAQYRAEKSSRLLVEDKIKARIDVLCARVAEMANEKFDITADKVLQELAAIAFANSGTYFDWGTIERPLFNKGGVPRVDANGNQVTESVPYVHIKPSADLTRQQLAAIVGADMSFSKTGDPMVSIKMADKRAALRDLGQHLKLFSQGIDLGGKGGGPIQIVISSAEDAL